MQQGEYYHAFFLENLGLNLICQRIQMNLEQLELEYKNCEYQVNSQESWKVHTLTRQLMSKLSRFADDMQINLQQSIPILNQIGIFRELTSIPSAKRMMEQGHFNSLRLQYQAKFIYCLWKLIDEEVVELQEFKQIICLFLSKTPDQLQSILAENYSDNQTLSELMQVWQQMLNQSNHSIQDSVNSQGQWQNSNYRTKIEPFRQYNSNQMSINQKIHNQNWYQKGQSRLKRNRNKQNPPFINYSKYMKHKKQQDSTNTDYIPQYSTQVPSLTMQKQKELVSRLYRVDKYQHFQQIKKIQDQQKLQKQLSECTFQPNINKKSNLNGNKPRQVKKIQMQKGIAGFQTAIKRMKVGQQKNKQLKQRLEFRGSKNWSTFNKKQNVNVKAPSFLNRKKKQEQIFLFSIEFDIGRNKICLKVKQSDNQQSLARNIQLIYSLKEDQFLQIKQIIRQQLQCYRALNQGTGQDQQNQ